MTYDITIRGEFTAIRTSKSGKETHRGILGVLTSGNKTERQQLASVGIEHAIENNNYRAIMREVTRVFPAGVTFKKSANALYNKERGDLYFRDLEDTNTFEQFLFHNPNKAMSLAYAREVIDAVARGDVALKGEREYWHGVCATVLDRESARIAAQIAEELARIESEASAEAGTELAL
jgi:hypothetical protein